VSSLGVKPVEVTLTDKDPSYKRTFNLETFRRYSDVEPIIEALRAKGILASAQSSNGCASDEDGHYHPLSIDIHGIPEKVARKLLR